MKVHTGRPRIRIPGFRFGASACGIKASGRRDVAVIASDVAATAVAAFTTNRVKAAPVLIGQARLRAGRVQAVVVNSGNANALTGAAGLDAARVMAQLAGHHLGIDERLVVPSSTGRIGVQLPMRRVRRGIAEAVARLSAGGFHEALEGIMTTDAFPKFGIESVRLGGRDVTIAALAKGAGMIAPNMATLLVYVLTDARVTRLALRRAFDAALPETLNAIVVDGDMSTNDTVLVLANGVAGNPAVAPGTRDYAAFAAALQRLLAGIARLIVKDGEGATRVVEIAVRGARSAEDAARVADAIARSPLCKTAFFGGDPYAGRVVCAAGYSGAVLDPNRLDVYLDDLQIVRRGVEVVRPVERRASRIASRPEFRLTLDLHAGAGKALRLASDLTIDYVRFNSAYRT
ncbi:MAG: bifunctional glutamate N-acetyltransferase/amino-acid acetyltransferase ArgJ [Candidatus Binatia bacterium]